MILIEPKWRNEIYVFKSNSFAILKLESPYSDHCFNYLEIRFRDREDAIADCGSNQTHISNGKVIPKFIFKFSNLTLSEDIYHLNKVVECRQQFSKVDCDVRLYLTQTTILEFENSTETYVRLRRDSDASISVVSKPRIDHIDYVTYILGALGSWIGFSFIRINPIPLLFKIDKSDNYPINYYSYSNMKFIRRELMQMKRESIKMKQHISSLERKLKR